MVRFVDGVAAEPDLAVRRGHLPRRRTRRVAALLIAKASLAAERGVDLRLAPDVPRRQGVRRAVARPHHGRRQPRRQRARRRGRAPAQPRVEVRLVGAGRRRSRSRSRDTGPGVRRSTEEVFRQGFTTKASATARRRPRLRAGADPAGLPAPRRGRDRAQRRHGGACSPRPLPRSTAAEEVRRDRGAGRRRRLHGGPDPHRLRRADARLRGRRRRAHRRAGAGRGASGCSPTWCCSTSTCPTCPGSTCSARCARRPPRSTCW